MKKVVLILAGLVSFAHAQDSTGKRPVPVSKFKVWVNGQSVDASMIDVDCVEDDLATTANFRYTLKDSTGASLAQGFIKMSGADYIQYSTAPNHADRATNWVIRQLNLARRQQIQAAKVTTASGTINR